MSTMLVCIHYTGHYNFPVLLSQVQPQLSEDDDIYVVDSSPQRDGVKLCQLYGSNRCIILVEPGDYDGKKALELAMEYAQNNNHKDMMAFPDNSFISTTLVQNYKRAMKIAELDKPQIIETPYFHMPPDFRWYNPDLKSEIVVRLPHK